MTLFKNSKHYAWDFKTPKKLIKPIKLEWEKHTWVQLPENIELSYQESLFLWFFYLVYFVCSRPIAYKKIKYFC